MNIQSQISNVTKYNRYPDLFNMMQILYTDNSNINILSFGCSTGEETRTIAEYFPNSTIYGVDICENIIADNKKNNTNKNIHYLLPNELNKLDIKFDIVFALSVLCLYPDNQSSFYNFDIFEKIINDIYKFLNVNGYIVMYNSNYIVEDTNLSKCFVPLKTKFFIKDSGFVPKYNKNRSPINNYNNVIFKKIS